MDDEKKIVSPINIPDLSEINDKNTTSKKSLDFINEIPLTITAVLGDIKMNIEDVLNLGPGSLIILKRKLTEPIDILINDKIVAKGEILAVEGNFGIRITDIMNK